MIKINLNERQIKNTTSCSYTTHTSRHKGTLYPGDTLEEYAGWGSYPDNGICRKYNHKNHR